MYIYDTLIIGCGYFAVGYAASHQGSVICEEHQICDVDFYLPMRSFKYSPYTPLTDEGTKLFEIFNSTAAFCGAVQNTSLFESALCKYISARGIKVLLKCCVISTQKRDDGIYDVTTLSNEGLTHLYARKILRTHRKIQHKRYTVLFTSDNIERDKALLLDAFPDGEIEPTCYEKRYALHTCGDGMDENSVKLWVYEKWCALDTDAKILYMAPVFYERDRGDSLCDGGYDNPIEAFEAGVRFEYKECGGR